MRCYLRHLICAMTLVTTITSAHENTSTTPETTHLPLFEWGFFIASGYISDYPASDETTPQFLIFPAFRYRGSIFRSDEEEGTRARILQQKNWDIDVSASAAFPTESEHNKARKGMDDLDWLFEFGPRLLYYLHVDPNDYNLKLGLPVRAVFSTDFSALNLVGYVLAPSLSYEKFNLFHKGWSGYAQISPLFLTDSVADYFFRVKASEVTADRAEYDARGGYLGTDVSLSYEFQFNRWEIFIASRSSFYHGSVNQDGPLHKADFTQSFFLGFVWLFHESEARGYK